MYTYVLGARGERTRSLRGVIRERRTGDMGREKEREREIEKQRAVRSVEEEGRENDATPLEGCGRGYEGATEEEGHWDARNESLLVPRRNGALGRPNRRGTKARRVPARERGVRIGQWKEREREASGRMREREETGGYDRRTARRVINNRAAAPALFPSLALALALARLLPLSSLRVYRCLPPRSPPPLLFFFLLSMVSRVRASLETAYRSRQKTLGCSLTLDRRRLPRARRIDDGHYNASGNEGRRIFIFERNRFLF